MEETAAHLTDHVYPRLPVRQWVLSVPKRLHCYNHRQRWPTAQSLSLGVAIYWVFHGCPKNVFTIS